MKHALTTLVIGIALMSSGRAQTPDPNPAITSPDRLAWQLFAMVNKSVPSLNNNVVFETWAANEDTFKPNPVFPGASASPTCPSPQVAAVAPQPAITPTASPKILNVPALIAFAPREAGLEPHVTVGGSEETRRNRATFDFIVCNKYHTKAGLRAAFASGVPISFPPESMEVKANWVPAGNLDPAEYHINTASDTKRYALVSMHIISKQVPNWTWATFEHKSNAGRCDFIGCHDKFGAVVADVDAHNVAGGPYDPCVKTPALKKLFADAGLPAMWENYCLKGSQVDFVTPTGVPTRLGNSVTERGFANTSSCLTCHARASVNARGLDAQGAGFLDPSATPALCPSGPSAKCSPNGAPLPAWFWTNLGQPDPTMLAMQTDFVWSVALRAIGP